MDKMSRFDFSERHTRILELLSKQGSQGISDLTQFISEVSSKTLLRDLSFLEGLKLIEKTGQARATNYRISELYNLRKKIDSEKYFEEEQDQRKIKSSFNFEIFEILSKYSDELFSSEELEKIFLVTEEYRKRKKKLSKVIIDKEFERLTIEFAWKSSKIEGNTYSLLETETLLKTGIESPKHSQEEKQMLLNHKYVLDFLLANLDSYKGINLKSIFDLHSMLVDKLDVKKQIRTNLVGITGTNYKPLDNEFQLREALENSCRLINESKEPISKALLASALLAYIQAFEDGNKRTARLLTNAVLMAYDYCPLSFRSIDINEYKKAILVFYEQNNISLLKQLLIEQYEFAVENYFL